MKKIFPVLGLAILISAAVITLAITKEAAKDPVCGMEVDAATATLKIDSPHGAIYFCSQGCMDKFQANPSAYVKTTKTATTTAKSGCEGCAGQSNETTAAAAAPTKTTTHGEGESCDGQCGQTKLTALNKFHELMPVLETRDVAKIKTNTAELVSRKAAVMAVECPDGVCPNGFGAARTAFGEKVDALVAAIQKSDDAAILSAFDNMHKAYETLDILAR
jgi:YHS domain-containing protein